MCNYTNHIFLVVFLRPIYGNIICTYLGVGINLLSLLKILIDLILSIKYL